MKKRVVFSAWSVAYTLVLLAVYGVLLYTLDSRAARVLWVVLIVWIVLLAVWYMPWSVAVTGDAVEVHRLLRARRLPLSEIRTVRMCAPTVAEKRILGSGGFMGYWGWFSERDLGKYFAYYGKASDCFLVEMKSGRKYMLGCKDAPEVVEAIRSKVGS